MNCLDLERIEELKQLDEDGGAETLKQLINLYIANTHSLIKNLNKYFADGNWIEVRHKAHSIRSASLNIGAQLMADTILKIEFANDQEIKNSNLAHLHECFELTKAQLLGL